MRSIKEESQKLFDTMVKHRRTLHENPEIGMDLKETTAYVMSELKKLGYKPVEIAPCAVTAEIGSGEKTILLRADMDALPMEEINDLEYKSKNNYAHLCGHDMHTAMLLGVAEILKEREAELEGRVRFMFQPGEEVALGAKSMVDAGILEGVDVAMALHVDNELEVGKISYVKGCASASLDAVCIEVQGRGGHSSMPHLSVDPLMIVNNIYSSLNTFVGREVDPQETCILTIGKMGGGTAANIIPDTAVLEGTLRCFNPEVRDFAVRRTFEIIEQTTNMLRGSYKKTLDRFTLSVVNESKLCDEMHKYMTEVLGEENVIIDTEPLVGTEDFSHVSSKVPAILAWIGAGGINDYPLHNPNLILNEEVMPNGCAVLANCAINWLKNNK